MTFGADISETLGNVGNRTTAHGYNKPDEIRKQYTGYEHDDESGLDFAQARYYNASHGRFTSIDPLTASASIKDPQTFNRYTYAMNSPYKFTDPLGLISSSTNACGQWCRNSATSSEMDTARVGKGFSDEGHQAADQPEPPPAQATSQSNDLTDAEIRARYPVFNSADQAVVNQAITDATSIVDPRGLTNITPAILTGDFRNPGDTTTPQQAIDSLDATSGNSVQRNENGQITEIFQQNVFDGRTSTLPVDHDNNPQTPNITVAEFFSNTPTVNAITADGYVFLGQGFFDQNAESRAKTMIHEGVVHKGFNRRDTEFGTTRSEGSRKINSNIDKAYRSYRKPNPPQLIN